MESVRLGPSCNGLIISAAISQGLPLLTSSDEDHDEEDMLLGRDQEAFHLFSSVTFQ